MKKYIFSLLLFTAVFSISSCKKTETVNQESPALYNTSVKYQFSATGTALSYSVSYTASDGTTIVMPVTLTATNQSWSSGVISIADTRVVKSVTFKVSCATITASTPVILSVADGISSLPLSTATYTFTSTIHDGNTIYTF